MDLGFQPSRVLSFVFDPAASGHSDVEVSQILEEALVRVRRVPGVTAASLAASTPGGGMSLSMSVKVPGYTPEHRDDDIVDVNFVSPSYFSTVGEALLRGRDFSDRDGKGTHSVAIVNEAFERRFLKGKNGVGFTLAEPLHTLEIVGVVADAHDRRLRGAVEPILFAPERQWSTSGLILSICARSESEVYSEKKRATGAFQARRS